MPCSSIVKQYSKPIGGVDLAGKLFELYRVPLKSKLWYLSIFGFVLDLFVVNAWFVYQRKSVEKKMCLKAFRINSENCFMATGKRKIRRPSLNEPLPLHRKIETVPVSVQDIHYDGLDHWPDHAPKGRCKY